MDAGDCSGAVSTLEQSLAVARRWRPEDHVDIAHGEFFLAKYRVIAFLLLFYSLLFLVLRLLSRCYLSLGDVRKATRLADESLSIIKSTHDPRHPLVSLC